MNFIVPEHPTMSSFIMANKPVISQIVKTLYLKHGMAYYSKRKELQSASVQLEDIEQCVLIDICKHWNLISEWTKEPTKLMPRMYELCRTADSLRNST